MPNLTKQQADALAADFHALYGEPETRLNASKTVKVRIAVVVDKEGKYAATGYTAMTDDHAFDFLIEGIADGEARYWLEAELPIPKIQVVKASVKNA
jgi:hypothetical protein